ncbi:MAG: ParA family protein [Myxococcales bacterium]|nr:ParA family protein [Myxococcales bacterium]
MTAAAPLAATPVAEPGKRAFVLAVAAQKGGVGKTTTSVSIASAWARFHGLRVLLVDLDPQGHVDLAVRQQITDAGGPLSSVLADRGATPIGEIAASTTVENLWVTRADPGLLSIEERLAGRIGRETVLRRAIERSRENFDVIVLDCPPNLGLLTINALVAADRVLVPAEPSPLGLAGVHGLFDAVNDVRDQLNDHIEVLGVVLTRMDGRNTRTNSAVLASVERTMGDLLLPVHVHVDAALAQAQLAGEDVFAHRPTSRAAEQYQELAEMVLSRR